MILNLFNVIYVLIAIAMIALILLQRGAGAQAGSGFGGGASGTVFGARGASTFLSRSTAVLAAVFFVLSLAMAWYLGRNAAVRPADDLGVTTGIEAPKATITVPAPNSDVPAAPAGAAAQQSAPAASDVPAAPAASQQPAPTNTGEKKSDDKAADAKKH